MADNPNGTSGSRWEPDPTDQPTERLAGPVEPDTQMIPGMQVEAPAAPAHKRRIPKAAAAVAIVAAATIGGGAIGLAVASNSTENVSDSSVTGEATPGTPTDLVTPELAPDGGFGGDHDGYGPGGHFGPHGTGGHR